MTAGGSSLPRESPRAAPPSDPRWIRYADTLLDLGPGRLRVDLRELPGPATCARILGLGLGASFAVWTAENPEGEPVDPLRNAARTERLEGELRERGVPFLPAVTESADGAVRERCVAAALSLPDAIAAARALAQMALIWFDTDHFALVGALIESEPVRLPLGP